MSQAAVEWTGVSGETPHRSLTTPARPSVSWREAADWRVAVADRIVPRLALAHSEASAAPPPAWIPATGEVARLAACAVSDPQATAHWLEQARQDGATPESLYLDLLAPAARVLGELWEDDRVSFADVTIAVGRLRGAVRDLGESFRGPERPARPGRVALLAPAPGEQHGFGLVIVADFLRRAGWAVMMLERGEPDVVAAAVRAQWFAIVGFSAACGEYMESLAACIRRTRRASMNRELGVMVGGHAFSLEPALVSFVGADSTASDGRAAAFQAEGLLSVLPRLRA